LALALALSIANLPSHSNGFVLEVFILFFMKSLFFKCSLSLLMVLSFCVASLPVVSAATAPKSAKKEKVGSVILTSYLVKDKPVLGEVGMIVPPKEISKYIAKVQAAAKQDPEWYREYTKKSKPGLPLPFHEKLGLTKDEYADYLKLWDQRQFKVSQKVVIRLEEPKPGEWMIRVSGVGMPISLLRYYPDTDQFKSTNGVLKRIEDINAPKESVLGAWKGQEWRFEEKTEYVWTKENIAIGKTNDGLHCFLVYRIQESVTGYNKSLVIRFAPPKVKASKTKKK